MTIDSDTKLSVSYWLEMVVALKHSKGPCLSLIFLKLFLVHSEICFD